MALIPHSGADCQTIPVCARGHSDVLIIQDKQTTVICDLGYRKCLREEGPAITLLPAVKLIY